MKPKDGGPAFPQLIVTEPGSWATWPVPWAGCSLRDYFAAAALPGVISARTQLSLLGQGTDINQESIAEECYELADAMLLEREPASKRRRA